MSESTGGQLAQRDAALCVRRYRLSLQGRFAGGIGSRRGLGAGGAQDFVFVGNQVEREGLFCAEVFMGPDAVPGHAHNFGACCLELVIQVTEVLSFACATRCVIFGIEPEDEAFAAEIFQ